MSCQVSPLTVMERNEERKKKKRNETGGGWADVYIAPHLTLSAESDQPSVK